MGFLDSQKEELVNKLEEQCLNHNFGTLNKADFDLLMFHHYMEVVRKMEKTMTNYEISKQLGITVQRVTALKDREASRYPYEGTSWRNQFLKLFHNAYTSGDKLVINIPDRRLYRELESFLETQGLGAEYDLNPTLFKADPELFINAIKRLYPGNEQLMNELNELALDNNPVEKDADKMKKLKVAGKYVMDFAANVLAAVISNKISTIC